MSWAQDIPETRKLLVALCIALLGSFIISGSLDFTIALPGIVSKTFMVASVIFNVSSSSHKKCEIQVTSVAYIAISIIFLDYFVFLFLSSHSINFVDILFWVTFLILGLYLDKHRKLTSYILKTLKSSKIVT